jgi:hypothetical protein
MAPVISEGIISGMNCTLLKSRPVVCANADALVDASGDALARLGVRDDALYLVRPDGYVAYRCAGRNLAGVEQYLARWFIARD